MHMKSVEINELILPLEWLLGTTVKYLAERLSALVQRLLCPFPLVESFYACYLVAFKDEGQDPKKWNLGCIEVSVALKGPANLLQKSLLSVLNVFFLKTQLYMPRTDLILRDPESLTQL